MIKDLVKTFFAWIAVGAGTMVGFNIVEKIGEKISEKKSEEKPAE